MNHVLTLLAIAAFVFAHGFAAVSAADGEAGAKRANSSAAPRPEPGPRAGSQKKAGKRIARAVGLLLLVLAALVLFLVLMEDRFIYYPSRYPAGEWPPAGVQVEDCYFETGDGLRLHGWWHGGSAQQSPTGPVILWFHGNAGNISHRAENMRMLARRGLDFLIIDYRGYGRSEGRPSEQGLYADGEAAYEYLTGQRSVSPERVICFGRSLGAAVALHVALRKPCAGLVLESPFESVKAMARKILPVLPVWMLLRSEFDNLAKIPRLAVPVLVIHGDRDTLVPIQQGRAVFDAAPEPKEFYTIEGANHNDTYVVGGEPYFERLLLFCRRCVSGGS